MEIKNEIVRAANGGSLFSLQNVQDEFGTPDEDGAAVAVNEDDFWKMEVPDDASCLFWAVAMAYLLPVRNNINLFGEKCERLFGAENVSKAEHVRQLLLTLNGGWDFIYEDSELVELVTSVFRNRVTDELLMVRGEEKGFHSVSIEDFLLTKNETFITDGIFRELFQFNFPSLTPLIDLSKLKPEHLNERSVEVLNAELEKVLDMEKVHKFKFHAYSKAMRNVCAWAGKREIEAMQSLLQCQIFTFSRKNISTLMMNKNSVNICLLKANQMHYDFGLVKPQIVIESIMKLNYELAFTLVKLGVSDVKFRYNNDWTLLHFASLTNDFRNIIKRLVWQGADVNLTTKNNHTPLQMAEYFELEKATASLRSLMNENTRTTHAASHKQNQTSSNVNELKVAIKPTIESAEELQSHYITIFYDRPQPSQLKQSFLLLEVFKQSLSFAHDLVIKKGAANVDFIKINIEFNDNTRLEILDWIPLHYAVEMGDMKKVKDLVEKGKARVDIKDRSGGTPLQIAVECNQLKVAQYLIERGADINLKDEDLVSALCYAARAGYDRIVQFLIENGAEINVVDKNSTSPVHHAVVGGHWKAVECLLENGALMNGLSNKQKQNIYQKFISSSSQDVQLAQTLSSGNVEFLEKLISENKKKLDKSLFKNYQKLKLMNVPLSRDMCVFVENKVMEAGYFSKNNCRLSELKNTKPNFENIKRRVQLIVKSIIALEKSSSDIDDIFLFNGKFIAKNVQILKRQLPQTREVLPWEEMQFYLVTFLSSYVAPTKVDRVAYLVMHKKRLVNYLIMFKKELLEKENGFENNCVKGKTRVQIKDNIISLNPGFKDLYQDFEHLRDVYSLKRIEEYLKIACSVDLNANPALGQLVIERALQVIGECLKNTRDSPNLSDNVNDTLLYFAPKNVRKILTVLRDSMSHVESLLTIITRKDKESFCEEIQHDLKKLQREMTYISFRKKCAVVKSFLERIISSKSLDDFYVDTRKIQFHDICVLEERNNNNNNNCFDKIADCLSNLKSLLKTPTEFQKESFKDVEKFVNQKSKNEEIATRHVKYLYKIERLMGLIQLGERNLDDIHRVARSILSDLLTINHIENRNNLNRIFFVVADLRHSFGDWEEAKQIASDMLHIIKFDAEKIQNIDQFKRSFRNESKNGTLSISLNEIDDKISLFISELSEDIAVRNKIKEEVELKRRVYHLKSSLIMVFNKEILVDKIQFITWMEKINFKLTKKRHLFIFIS